MSRIHSNSRSRHNDSMSMDDYSDIAIADKSSKFRKSHSGKGGLSSSYQRREMSSSSRKRGNLRASRSSPSGTEDTISTRSTSTPRSSMEEDMIRHQQHMKYYSPPKRQQTPRALESLVQQPRSTGSSRIAPPIEKVSTPSPSKANHRKQIRQMPKQIDKQKPKQQKQQKPVTPKKSKLKMLNCFSSSNKPQYDDEEGVRQQAVIAREHFGRNLAGAQSKDLYSFDEDVGNSPTAGMSVITTRTEDCYKDATRSISSRTTTRRRNDKTIRRGGKNSTVQHILEDLQEEENELTSAYSNEERGGSFINLSISDIEEQLERREAVPLSTVEEKRHETRLQQEVVHEQEMVQKAYGGTSTHQVTIQSSSTKSPPKQKRQPPRSSGQSPPQNQPRSSGQSPPQNQQQQRQYQQNHPQQRRISGTNAPNKVESRRQSPPQKTQDQNHRQEQRISATTSVVQGVVTPPRGAASTSWMTKTIQSKTSGGGYDNGMVDSSFGEPSVTYTYHSGSTLNNTNTSNTTTSLVNLASEKQKQQQQKQEMRYEWSLPKPQPKQKIGPRCHFCGGPHWIYNCPHMDETSTGRRKRREGRQQSSEDESSTTTGESTTMDYYSSSSTTTTTNNSSSLLPGMCHNNNSNKQQSTLLQCQPCFKHVTKVLAASLQQQDNNNQY